MAAFGKLWAVAAMLGGSMALADGQGLATFGANNGTVAPPYRWSLDMTIDWNREAIIRYCRGYEQKTDACAEASVVLSEAAVATILSAAAASDLAKSPAQVLTDPPVGGGMTFGSVVVDGIVVDLPPHPVDDDVARVEAVLAAIEAAVPTEVVADLESRAKAPE